MPPDEAEAYVPPHKTVQPETEIPTRLQFESLSIEDVHIPGRPKTKAQIKNEKKNKNKREKKLLKNSEQNNDHLFTEKLDPMSLDGVSQNGITLETTKLKKAQPNASPDSTAHGSKGVSSGKSSSIPVAKKGSASQQNETNDDLAARTLELEKQQKKLLKKLEQIDKLVQKGDELNAEEISKIEKKGAWEQEIKEIGKQLIALRTR